MVPCQSAPWHSLSSSTSSRAPIASLKRRLKIERGVKTVARALALVTTPRPTIRKVKKTRRHSEFVRRPGQAFPLLKRPARSYTCSTLQESDAKPGWGRTDYAQRRNAELHGVAPLQVLDGGGRALERVRPGWLRAATCRLRAGPYERLARSTRRRMGAAALLWLQHQQSCSMRPS